MSQWNTRRREWERGLVGMLVRGDLLKLLVLAVEGDGKYGGMKGSISWVGRAGNNGAGTGWGEQKWRPGVKEWVRMIQRFNTRTLHSNAFVKKKIIINFSSFHQFFFWLKLFSPCIIIREYLHARTVCLCQMSLVCDNFFSVASRRLSSICYLCHLSSSIIFAIDPFRSHRRVEPCFDHSVWKCDCHARQPRGLRAAPVKFMDRRNCQNVRWGIKAL